MPTPTTGLLEIAYQDDGPPAGPPVLLLHGWPDSPRAWQDVAALLNEAGFRTIGGSDTCVAPEATEDKAVHFTAGYRRVVVPGAGHFVPREAPGTVAELVAGHLGAR